ncbi:aminotransferase class I/II-fold pyridoxal phosphate-dependent enzyme [Roseovarius faecimaris]|uniref:histidinol-phosphate transaminase n=1 Tax=Roseovarius faecimaris TaxID=2494550 RepID=A0A6I6IMU6_9RHOB|nr:histidinol-phosphate transaminase [Roseovarius faecimaris]QGX96807.1 aminotransferase class I/II-fold pyridoxal phosphate-dependent enzyme [Roseovarius faecimaris]
MIPPVPHIGSMAGYALADLSAPAGKRLVSLSQNESLRPPSPAVAEALARAATSPQLYPDPDWTVLREAIADRHEVTAANILCGNGSLDLIGCLARAYLDPGTAALAPAHAYPFFRTATQMTGARFDTASETGATVDVDALLAQVTPETRIVFVANPGNPTGTRISRAGLLRLREGLPGDVMLVIDEAYGEFADHLGERMFDLVERGDTVVLRTFSKAYGLAGMRVGWGLFPPAIAAETRKVMNPNNVALPGQMAAHAALLDHDYMRETCAQTAVLRDAFATRLRAAGYELHESFTNFALIRFASPEAAESANRALRTDGVFLRPQGGAGLPECLRATISVADDMDLAASLLEDWARNGGKR